MAQQTQEQKRLKMWNLKTILTEDQLAELKSLFPNTKNDDLCNRFNISASELHRLARKHGMRKTPEYMRQCQRHTSDCAKRANTANGYRVQRNHILNNVIAKGLHKNGSRPWEDWKTMTPEQKRERIEKTQKKRRELFEMDRRRIRWGLSQKSKMNLNEPNRQRACAKWYLLKHGYVFIKKWEFAFTDETTRCPKCEKSYPKKFCFRFIDKTLKNGNHGK